MANEMEHDSQDWREERNRRLAVWVDDALAEKWILEFFDFCEMIDDLIDGDPVSSDRVIRALWEAMVDMPGNPFFQAHMNILLPVVHSGINAWLDANALEAKGDSHSLHLSYVMRDSYGMIVQTCIEILHGRAALRARSVDIVTFFGAETFEEYAKGHVEST